MTAVAARPVSLDAPQRSPANIAGRKVAKAAIRSFGMATAAWRSGPDFIIIGAKRGGTTTLWKELKEHPQVRPLVPAVERKKGTYFFDENYGRGLRWYRSHFPLARGRSGRRRALTLVGEASPYYLYHPHAPGRVATHFPDVHRIAILRDPVERAYSHWKERVANGTEPLSFEDALHAEPERLAGEKARVEADVSYTSFAHRHQSYIDQGRYAACLRRWLDASAPGTVEILISEEAFLDWDAALARVQRRLGIAVRPPSAAVDAFNAQPSAPMSDGARRLLERALADDVRALEELLGRRPPWSIG